MIRKITKREFESYGPARTPGLGTVLADEKEWYVDSHGRILGILFQDRSDGEWGYAVQQRRNRSFEGVHIDFSQAEDAARAKLRKTMEQFEKGEN